MEFLEKNYDFSTISYYKSVKIAKIAFYCRIIYKGSLKIDFRDRPLVILLKN